MPVQNSIVVVNFDNAAGLRRMLANLKMEESTAGEVIVAAAASPDDSAAVVKRDFPHVKLVRREKNKGSAVGANRGMRQALGDVVVVCQSDVIADVHVLAV